VSETAIAPLWLIVRGIEEPRVVAMTGERLTIGRDLRSDVVLDDPKVSRLHAEIVRDSHGRYALTDLRSRNGTTIDGRQLVGSLRLRGGELLKIGRTVIEVSAQQPDLGG
jgi:pSer/pThr/pTyr-binding forkhead associated (FHA) protein